MQKKINLEIINYSIGVLLILLASFSPLFKTNILSLILIIILFPLALFNVLVLKKIIYLKFVETLSIGIIILILLLKDFYNLIHLEFQYENIALIIRLIVVIIYISTVNKEKFLKVLEKIVILLSSITIILYFWTLQNNKLLINNLVINKRLYNHYYGVYGYFEGRIYQNSGFTWEPSAWCILLGTILMIRIIKNPKVNIINFILMINILTSRSTTGYILFLIILAYIFFNKISIKRILIMIFLFSVCLQNNEINQKVYKKIFERNNYESLRKGKYEVWSSAARELHKKIDISIFKDNFFLGSNKENKIIRTKYTKKLSMNDKSSKYLLMNTKEYLISSNSFTHTLAKNGIFIFLVYYYLYFRTSLKSINRKKILNILILSFIFTVQEVNWLPYFIMLIFLQNIIFKDFSINKEKIRILN